MQAIIFTGIQASGKSTFYFRHFFNSHIRISMDLLNTRNKEQAFLETCFLTHTRFVVDNTNPSTEERSKYIAQAKMHKYEVVGYYFNSSVAAALARNDKRTGKEKIPVPGIIGCYKKLKLPSYDEGFDRIYQVQLDTNNNFSVSDLARGG